jgi:2-oxoisovalerate dehydrogenase E1 component alpha subunit
MGDYGEGFHVPAPKARPGEAPDFSNVKVPPAGHAPRPDPTTPEPQMRELAFDLVRVLDDEGKAVGPWAPEIPEEILHKALRAMEITRAMDDRLFRAHRQGKTSFYMKSTGEEAIAVGQSLLLGADDMCFPTYRVVGWLIARDYPLLDLVNQVFSNAQDPLKGRQLPVLYSAKSHGFFSISGNLATQYIQAVGWAMASAMRGGTEIASAWIGEGSTAESDFHAALVYASTYQAPVILNIVNNHWAISTPEDFARGASATFADRGFGFSIPALRVDGNDYLAVYAASSWAAARARGNLGPTLIEWVTLRRGAHSTSDDPSMYRPDHEADSFPLGDPIDRLQQHLVAIGDWDATRQEQLQREVDELVETSFNEASSHGSVKTGVIPNTRTMFDDVFAEIPRHLREQREQGGD